MKNLVGDQLPSSQKAAEILEDVQKLREKLDKYLITLSEEERIRAFRMRPGSERVARRVGELATKHGVHLPTMSVEDMLRDLDLAFRIRPVYSALTALVQSVGDTVIEAESEAWHSANANYSVLLRISSANPELAAELAETRAFFATGKRNKKAAPAKGKKKPAAGGTKPATPEGSDEEDSDEKPDDPSDDNS